MDIKELLEERTFTTFTKTDNQILFYSFIYLFIHLLIYLFIYILGFTPCKAKQPLRGMKLQEKESQKHTGNLLRMNLQLKNAC